MDHVPLLIMLEFFPVYPTSEAEISISTNTGTVHLRIKIM